MAYYDQHISAEMGERVRIANVGKGEKAGFASASKRKKWCLTMVYVA